MPWGWFLVISKSKTASWKPTTAFGKGRSPPTCRRSTRMASQRVCEILFTGGRKAASDLPAVDADGLAARMRDPFHWRPKGGESYEDLMTRTRAWLEGIERDCVVVSHGGVSRTLRGHVLGLDVATVPLLDMPQDRVLILQRGTSEWI